MHLSPAILGRAEILNLDFDDETSVDVSANVVTWLIDIFAIRHAAELALATSRKLGDNHFIAIADGLKVTQAFLADTPQSDPTQLTGLGLNILGSHPLSDLATETLNTTDNGQVRIGSNPFNIQFVPGEEDLLLALAEEFPWYRKAFILPKRAPSMRRVVDICLKLGMPRVLINQPD